VKECFAARREYGRSINNVFRGGPLLNTGNKQNLHLIDWGDRIGSVQTPADSVRVDGFEDTGYLGWKWTLLGYPAHG
jgi:hypothetical protein